MHLSSSAFRHQEEIPVRHTCDGENTPPELAWSGAPAGTRSFVLIVDDPDAPDPRHPRQTWVHWLVYNLPADCTGLLAGQPLPAGTQLGRNDWNTAGYGGPCPPIGRHRYFHKLYALDAALPDLKHPAKPQLEQAMKGHVLAQVELVGTYER
ncbi:MAG TPA: YbhB/YbcL family Raf kinase inhibitor-like protein [Acidiferrobacterales bacterium]|nr:YbhB/YbcL family Raf kinase inhibitor-like protein [Acidiferrobacterales bacterium]